MPRSLSSSMKNKPTAAVEALRICKRLFPWRVVRSLPQRHSSAFAPPPQRLPARSLSRGLWPSQPLALRLDASETGAGAVADPNAFLLCDSGQDANDRITEDTQGIDVLLRVALKLDS